MSVVGFKILNFDRWKQLCFLASSFLFTSEIARGETQRIVLETGWNVIAVQVEPDDPSPANVFGGVPGLISVWEFDNVSKNWLYFGSEFFDSEAGLKNSIEGVAISEVHIGNGFWVQMNNAGTLTMEGTKPLESPSVELTEGWNLVGIPVTGPGSDTFEESLPLVSLLTLQGLDYDVLLQWQAEAPGVPGYERSQFGTTEDTNDARDNIEEFRTFDPNRGYWIHVTQSATLSPQLLATVRGDVDVPPVGNFPDGPEDVVISGQETPISSDQIRRIVLFEEETSQPIYFSNDGGGLLLWEAEILTESNDHGEPWLSLSFEPGNPDGAQRLSGALTTQSETIHLRVDRKNLTRSGSPYIGELRLKSSEGGKTETGAATDVTRVYEVVVHVGGIQGDWSGFAEISSVNGRRNAIPDIDLSVSLFEDRAIDGLIRGSIDSAVSALWPVDVQLVGHVTDGEGNGFQLGGAYVLPPGDRNNEPYDLWDHNDIDWNDDGFLPADRVNPYPFPIYRSVTMDGAIVSANGIDNEGFAIEGVYREVVYGMLRTPILLEGRFSLTRDNYTPFASRNSVVRGGGGVTASTVTGPSPSSRVIAAGQSLAPELAQVTIDQKLILESVKVSFSIKRAGQGALDASDFEVSLLSPGGDHELILHDGAPVDPLSFASASYPGSLTPLGSNPTYEGFVAGISDTSGNWRLRVSNNLPYDIRLSDFDLTLYGQPVVDIYGNAPGASGGTVALGGLPFSNVDEIPMDGDGSFVVRNVVAMPVYLTASHPAFQTGFMNPSQLVPSFTISNASEAELQTRFANRPLPAVPPAALGVSGFGEFGSSPTAPFELDMIPLPEDEVEVLAFPEFGMAGVETEFYALHASPTGISWGFGDGSPVDTTSGVSASHFYEDPGVYEVTLTHSLGSASRRIVVWQSPGGTLSHPDLVNDPDAEAAKYVNAEEYQAYIFTAKFSGGGSLPVNYPASLPGVEPKDYPDISPAADLVMLQHMYAASADIDLAPSTVVGGDFADDRFTEDAVNYWASDLNEQPPPGVSPLLPEDTDPATPAAVNDPGWTYEDHNYVLWPAKWFSDPNENWRLDTGEDDYGELTRYSYGLGGGNNDTIHEDPRPTSGFTSQEFNYYRIACNIGSTISPVGIYSASVRGAQADPVTSPDLEAGPVGAGIARNLKYKLTTNLLGGLPVASPESQTDVPSNLDN